ncbi:MAG TPA: GlsB/YeaQ/YmgE family stress response membrane protein [Bradyrhizobium sp.]|nr:GlsB/YeaQ/YmgE family stress response membrane protein [Bradyrhizobium sp.]
MNMSSESLLAILFVGLVAGWLAGQIVRGTGFGIVGDLIVGVLGALIGSWLLPQLGIHLGTGLINAIVNATIGAILLLFLVRLFRGGGGWGSRWGGGWWGRRW